MNAQTFILDSMRGDEVSTPVMEIFKMKIKSKGTLDKLKPRIVVCGDLQGKATTEDKWSPTASFWSLKMFLAHASRELQSDCKSLCTGPLLVENIGI